MSKYYRLRRLIAMVIVLLAIAIPISKTDFSPPSVGESKPTSPISKSALAKLNRLAVKGRAPMTGYSRELFGGTWTNIKPGCDARDVVLRRDMTDVVVNSNCQVTSGRLDDPYTGKVIHFKRGPATSSDVQIDHVVAIGDAWQTGARQLSLPERKALYVDPLELLAVDGPSNQQKSDGDAATWLPPNKPFRCQYVSRQVDIKLKYHLWVTPAEKDAIKRVLSRC